MARRFLNFVIDLICWQIISIVVLIVFLLVDLLLGVEFNFSGDILFKIFYFIAFWLYYFGFELVFQRTIGKMITGTKVISQSGERPNVKAIFIRTLIRSIPLEYLSFLYSRDGHHDCLSNTKVVRSNSVEAN